MGKRNVLFVCVHNSARSQMAEAFLIRYGSTYFDAESAGIEPGVLNPTVVESMREIGFDISKNKTKNVLDFVEQDEKFHFVVTVCDEASAERCPVFPGGAERIHWSFKDPSSLTGSKEEELVRIREIRDAIKKKVRQFIEEHSTT